MRYENPRKSKRRRGRTYTCSFKENMIYCSEGKGSTYQGGASHGAMKDKDHYNQESKKDQNEQEKRVMNYRRNILKRKTSTSMIFDN